MAEMSRTPFDIAIAESEIVGGPFIEYSGMRWGMFFLAEFAAVFLNSALATTLFLGGWGIPWYVPPPTFGGFLLSALSFLLKVSFLMFVFVWVRWTIPRLKYDILMKIGWKFFLPLALLNVVLVALFIAEGWI
jgi:NADH-quinone oxidoreductase subunit H